MRSVFANLMGLLSLPTLCAHAALIDYEFNQYEPKGKEEREEKDRGLPINGSSSPALKRSSFQAIRNTAPLSNKNLLLL